MLKSILHAHLISSNTGGSNRRRQLAGISSRLLFNARPGAILVGLKLFAHSVKLIFTDFGMALRVGGVLLAVQAITGLAGLIFIGAQGIWLLPGFVFIVISTATFLWFAVAWHRYVLLDEVPSGLMPKFSGELVLSYFIAGIIVALIGMIVMAVMMVPIGLVPASRANTPVLLLIGAVAGTIGWLIFFRIGLILPASALKQRLKVSEAWALTSGKSGSILALAIGWGLTIFLLDLIGTGLAGPHTANLIASLTWTALSFWLQTIVGVSILTTLYGFYVEKRPIGTLVPS